MDWQSKRRLVVQCPDNDEGGKEQYEKERVDQPEPGRPQKRPDLHSILDLDTTNVKNDSRSKRRTLSQVV